MNTENTWEEEKTSGINQNSDGNPSQRIHTSDSSSPRVYDLINPIVFREITMAPISFITENIPLGGICGHKLTNFGPGEKKEMQ